MNSEKFIVQLLGDQIEELDLIFYRNPKPGIFHLLAAQVGAPEQRSDWRSRLRRQSVSRAGYAAAGRRNVIKVRVFYLAHADSLAISRWLLQTKIWRNGAGPGLQLIISRARTKRLQTVSGTAGFRRILANERS